MNLLQSFLLILYLCTKTNITSNYIEWQIILMKIFLKIRCYKCCIKIYISEGTDLTKSNNSKECMICHYTFFNNGFKCQDSVCNGWHDLAILSVNISDIITIKNVEYRCIIHNIWSNLKQANLKHLKRSLLEESGYIYIKKNVLIFILFKTVFYYFFRLVYIYTTHDW